MCELSGFIFLQHNAWVPRALCYPQRTRWKCVTVTQPSLLHHFCSLLSNTQQSAEVQERDIMGYLQEVKSATFLLRDIAQFNLQCSCISQSQVQMPADMFILMKSQIHFQGIIIQTLRIMQFSNNKVFEFQTSSRILNNGRPLAQWLSMSHSEVPDSSPSLFPSDPAGRQQTMNQVLGPLTSTCRDLD